MSVAPQVCPIHGLVTPIWDEKSGLGWVCPGDGDGCDFVFDLEVPPPPPTPDAQVQSQPQGPIVAEAELEVLDGLKVHYRGAAGATAVDRVPMQSDRITIGRDDPSGRWLPDIDLSEYMRTGASQPNSTGAIARRHCEVVRDFEGDEPVYKLRNLTSKGGTWVDGQEYLMEENKVHVLADGDIFFVGDDEFAVGFRFSSR